MHSRDKKWDRKILNLFNEFIEKTQTIKCDKEKLESRCFPISLKDYELRNINEVKEKKRLEEERKKKLKQQRQME